MNDDKKQLTISLDYRTLLLGMALVYILTVSLMLFFWKPWDTITSETRRITTTGESLIEAEPDEFVFNPSYSFSSENEDAAIKEASAKTTEIVAELKKLGVEDKNIKVNGYNQDWYWYYEDTDSRVRVSITAKVSNKDTAQKVQEYLLTTELEGQITPTSTFSEAKRKELEEQGRSEAVTDAKTKAQTSASELDVRLGKVISVSDGYGFTDYPIAYDEIGPAIGMESVETVNKSIPVQPGEDELRYNVTVVFEIK